MDKPYFMLQQLLKDYKALNARGGDALHGGEKILVRRRNSGISFPALSLLNKISAEREKGQSYAAIAAALNKQGLTGRYGGRWYASSVSRYLQRRP